MWWLYTFSRYKSYLVAYFSATGTTESLAKKIANLANADLFKIEPETPYTLEDLDWTNKNSRSSIEMNNLSSRPKIANSITNIDLYDKIFIGFPIWWYIAPTIINTFLEQYNLNNKTIIPFATSGGSKMGETNKHLINSCPNANLIEGKVLSPHISNEELTNWLNNF